MGGRSIPGGNAVVNPCHDAALEYLGRGFSVIPLKPRDKRPALNSWKEFQTRRATPEEVARWFADCPGANLGLVCGSISGLVVVDGDGPEGERFIWEKLPRTGVYQRTGKPHGLHAFFRMNGTAVKNSSRRIPEVDVRGEGGYVVIAPSVHPNGTIYRLEYLPGFNGWDDLAPFEWPVDEAEETPPRGEFSKYGLGALRKILAWLATVEEGERNNQLNKAAHACGRLIGGGELDREEVEGKLTRVALALGSDAGEVERTIRSGLDAGILDPRKAEVESEPGGAVPGRLSLLELGPNPVARWLAEEPPEQRELFSGLFPRGIVAGIGGQGGGGKSFLVLQMGVSLASGRQFGPFRPAEKGRVLYLGFEDPEEILWRRLRAVVQVLGFSDSELAELPNRLFCYSLMGRIEAFGKLDEAGNPVPSGSFQELKTLLGNLKTDLLILDPKSRCFGLEENRNEHNTAWAQLLENLVADRPSMSVLFVHHARKGASELSSMTADHMFRGGAGLVDCIRLGFGLRPMTESDAEGYDADPSEFAELSIVKANYVERWPGSLHFRRHESGVLVPADLGKIRLENVMETLLEALGDYEGEPVSRRDIAKRKSCSKIRETLKSAPGYDKGLLDPAITLALQQGSLTEEVIETGPTRQPKRVLKVVRG